MLQVGGPGARSRLHVDILRASHHPSAGPPHEDEAVVAISKQINATADKQGLATGIGIQPQDDDLAYDDDHSDERDERPRWRLVAADAGPAGTASGENAPHVKCCQDRVI